MFEIYKIKIHACNELANHKKLKTGTCRAKVEDEAV